ncbi:MAG: cysteine desulfurase [Lactobacillales bacterium]|jgi:cysteine desulfurase|nr:cysteine desulfurase [Lactobacillales bacterium]
MIYFDHSATTQIFPEALDAYVKASQKIFGNPSSLHDLGNQADALLTQARQQIADIMGVSSSEVYFTSGGTEGINWILKGTAIEKRDFAQRIIISAIEHPAVYKTVQQLAKLRFTVDFAPVDQHGFVEIDGLKNLLGNDVILVSIIGVNNEIGSIQPIKQIANLLENYPTIHFHVDAVQAVGKIAKENYLSKRVDFATFSAHKFHGPRGVGFIYLKQGKRIASLLTGGGQEKNQRSGTENIPGIVAMAKALRLSIQDYPKKIKHVLALRNALGKFLKSYENVKLFTDMTNDFAAHILTFGLKKVRGEVMVHALAKQQIYLSTTSACSSRKKIPANTLKAMNLPNNIIETAVRLSLDASNTLEEVQQFMEVFSQLYKKFESVFKK